VTTYPEQEALRLPLNLLRLPLEVFVEEAVDYASVDVLVGVVAVAVVGVETFVLRRDAIEHGVAGLRRADVVL
jgi:hypothetical protein